MSRVLITTRANDLRHASYPAEGSNLCRYLPLQGLAEDDAIHWFQALMRLPPEPLVPLPEREPLKLLFAKVGFHPLSVGMLARQLKLRRIAELGERLEAFLKSEHGDPLLASLNLSLDRLDPQSTQFLPRLGVFHGGAIEATLTQVCELTEAQWLPLRQGLEQTGLLQAESLPGFQTPFLRFHPTLAPALWAKLPAGEQARLAARHREGYYQLSGELYSMDSKAVAATRAIAWRELPNLLAAAHRALNARDSWVVDCADKVSHILSWFDLRRDRAALNERVQAAAREVGSDDWYLAQSARGEALYDAGRYHEAEKVLADILPHLGDTPSHRRCLTLARLGRCYERQQQTARAEAIYRQALAEGARIEQTEAICQLVTAVQTDLGNALMRLGRYQEARAAHEAALVVAKALGDDRNVAVSLAQLGGIALEEGDLGDAESRYLQAIKTFRGLGERSTEAACWHRLGSVYLRARRLDQAERGFRESARIQEEIGNPVGASRSWNSLAQVIAHAGRPNEAEDWYIKALTIRQTEGDRAAESLTRHNLAVLLTNLPNRLADAKSQAEQALTIKKTLDPAAAEIWKNYSILANIADRQGDAGAARAWRREERASYAAAPVSRHMLRRHQPLIAAVVQATSDPSARAALEPALVSSVARGGMTSLAGTLRRILDGERDEDALCASLNYGDSAIVAVVLRGIADPATLTDLAPPHPDGDTQ